MITLKWGGTGAPALSPNGPFLHEAVLGKDMLHTS